MQLAHWLTQFYRSEILEDDREKRAERESGARMRARWEEAAGSQNGRDGERERERERETGGEGGEKPR